MAEALIEHPAHSPLSEYYRSAAAELANYQKSGIVPKNLNAVLGEVSLQLEETQHAFTLEHQCAMRSALNRYTHKLTETPAELAGLLQNLLSDVRFLRQNPTIAQANEIKPVLEEIATGYDAMQASVQAHEPARTGPQRRY